MDNFDFAQFDQLLRNQEAGTELKLRHPVKGTALGPTLTVVSYESQRVREAQKLVVDRRLKEQRIVTTPREADEDELVIHVACVVGWTGIVIDGENLAHSPENVEKFLRRFPFVREQINGHAGSRASFLQD